MAWTREHRADFQGRAEAEGMSYQEAIPVVARRYFLPPSEPLPTEFRSKGRDIYSLNPPSDHGWQVYKVRDEGWNTVTVFWHAAG
jgi:hypothetical protein